MIWLGVAAAGGIGSVLRVLITGTIDRRLGPRWGTHAVNILGTVLLAILVRAGDADMVFLLGVGLAGGLTTFSTWMVDIVRTGGEGNVWWSRTIGVVAIASFLAYLLTV